MKNPVQSSNRGRRLSSSNRRSQRARSKRISGVCAEIIEQRLLLSTYTVNTTSDAANPGPGLLTLRQAVADTNNNPGANTIAFNPTVFTPGSLHTITLTQGELDFTDFGNTTTVVGPGSSVLAVSGGGMSRVFEMDSETTVTMSGLQIIDGDQTVASVDGNTYGGGIYNDDASLTLINCAVSGNTLDASTDITTPGAEYPAGQAFGGGIYSRGSLTITGSTLSSNVATNTAPAPSVNHLASAGDAFGGAIYALGPLILSGDTISGNSVTANSVSGTGDLDGGEADGGGVYGQEALTITNSTITGNSAHAGNAADSHHAAAGGNADGGGVFFGPTPQGTSLISNSIISYNSVVGGLAGLDSGSAGAARGGGIYGAPSITVTNSTVSHNSATAPGTYNGDPSGGGGIYDQFGPALIGDTITDNSVTGGPPSLTDDRASAAGGGVFSLSSLSIQRSTISGNTVTCSNPAFGQSGGTSVGGGVADSYGGSIVASTISNNSVTGGNGYTNSAGDYSPQLGGTASGGGVWAQGTLTITDSTLTANAAVGGVGGNGPGGGPDNGDNGGNAQGGGIDAATLVLADSTVTGNSATGGAGGDSDDRNLGNSYPPGAPGIATGGGIADTTAVTLTNSIVSADTAGGIFNDIANPVAAGSYYNLIGQGGGLLNGVNGNIVGINNPQLSPLGNNGGPTQTMVPLSGSLAIDAGDNLLIPSDTITDQRGLARIVGKSVDIGAIEFQTIITGTVFNDLNDNGVQDAGELGIPGVTVYIDTTNAGVLKTADPKTTTDSFGRFTFSGLTAGAYIVRQILPTGDTQLFPTNGFGNHITLAAGQAATNTNFADKAPVVTSISGAVFVDFSIFDDVGLGDPGIPGVTVYIDTTNAGVFKTGDPQTTTDSQGNYIFTGLAPGNYIVRQIVPQNAGQIFPAGGFGNHITLKAGQSVTGANFGDGVGFAPKGIIAGTIFNDINGNGTQDSGELGIPNVPVYIDLDNTGVFQLGDPQTTTDATGVYSFNEPYGTYIVRQILPAGDKQISPANGFGNHVTIFSPNAIVSTVTNANFADQIPAPTTASISGAVYYDANGNGTRDLSEQGIPGVTVYIDLNNAGVFESGDPQTTTDSSGNYTFTGLSAGTYLIRQMIPAGDAQTFPASNSGNHITVTTPQSTLGANFGDQLTPGLVSSITGTVLEGFDGASSFAGVVGVPGVTVYIDANNNGRFDTGEISTTTNSAGVYTFTGLAPGNYDINAVPPAGSSGVFGLSHAIDGFGNYLTLAANQSVININFTDEPQFEVGLQPPALVGIGGIVFDDANGNGKRDSTEIGVPNVTVYVDLNNNGKLDPGEPVSITNGGAFSFSLPPGSYTIRQILPAGDKQTFPTSGNGNRILILPGTETFGPTVLFGDQGPVTNYSLTGFVFNDINNDGVPDDGEPGISGVVLYIDLNNTGFFEPGDPTATTDALGNFTFVGLSAGTYIVRQMVPKGFTQTSPTRNFGNHTIIGPNGTTPVEFVDQALT